jgi:hypothetical protein
MIRRESPRYTDNLTEVLRDRLDWHSLVICGLVNGVVHVTAVNVGLYGKWRMFALQISNMDNQYLFVLHQSGNGSCL